MGRARSGYRKDAIAASPPETGLPWTNPRHRGPLEVLASGIAGEIAGRPVSVQCFGETDCAKLQRTGRANGLVCPTQTRPMRPSRASYWG